MDLVVVTNDRINLDKSFFYRLFITSSYTEGRLSSGAISLAAFLLLYLSESEFRHLPKRSFMAKELNLSKTSTIAALESIENAELIIRGPSDEFELANTSTTSSMNEKEYTPAERNSWAGLFKINPFFGMSKQEEEECIRKNKEEILMKMLSSMTDSSLQDLITIVSTMRKEE